ncbi:MAG: FtsX-like permease family protein [Actinomycetota bacterium]
MLIVVAALSLPFLFILLFRPLLRRIAWRNAMRRPREALLVIAGSLLGTAIMTGSFVVGDTLDASIRARAPRQLGPVDEIVSVVGLDQGARLRERLAGFESNDVDGTLPATVVPAAAATVGENRRAEPQAQLLEVDFAEARRFGGDPEATGVDGDTPAAGHAVIGEDVADELRVGAGDDIEVFAYGQSLRLTVDRVLEQRGIAGLWFGLETRSPNVFVALGTIAELFAAAPPPNTAGNAAAAVEPPLIGVMVSNRGGIEAGAAHTDAVTKELEGAIEGLPANVLPVKQDLLEGADEAGRGLTELYTSMGMFAIAAGILLLVNIFVMLAEERKSELGMLRAVGLRRSALVGAFATEGWLYALVSSVIGTFLGLGLGRAITGIASRILSSEESFAPPTEFTADPASIQAGFAIGFAIALATVVLTSIRVSRFNIIQAIRDLNEPVRRRPRRRSQVAGLGLTALGVALTMAGFSGKNGVAVIIGPMLVLAGLGPSIARRFPKQAVATTLSALIIVWGIAALPVALLIDAPFEIFVFVVQGLTLAAAAVVLVSQNQAAIGRLLGRIARGSLDLRLGLAYPLARRFRTGMTLGMFSVVLFTLAYISILSHIFAGQLDTFTADVSGGFNVTVESNPTNPIAFEDLVDDPGVNAVAPLVTVPADVTRDDATEPIDWSMTAFDERLIEGGPPRLLDRGRYATDAEAWRAVLEDPDLAIVDEFFLSEDAGPPMGALDIGDSFEVADPVTGRARTLTVAAQAPDDWVFNGGWFGIAAARDVYGERAVPNRAYVDADDPDAFADAVSARYLANGGEGETISSIVDQNLTQQQQFFLLMRGYLGLGLLVGIAGLGVVIVRAVRERRREIGVLRALGFPAPSVRRAFVYEAAFVAVEGVIIGLVLALVTSYGLASTSDIFGDNFNFQVPVVALLLIAVATVFFALLATFGPARAAARIRPAVALRIAD